jgi:hypothetical protein
VITLPTCKGAKALRTIFTKLNPFVTPHLKDTLQTPHSKTMSTTQRPTDQIPKRLAIALVLMLLSVIAYGLITDTRGYEGRMNERCQAKYGAAAEYFPVGKGQPDRCLVDGLVKDFPSDND